MKNEIDFEKINHASLRSKINKVMKIHDKFLHTHLYLYRGQN